jgi:hypothetical protein
MENARNQLVEKIQSANHILVTVSNSPSVDQLASCIGLTLVLNKLTKHGTAVFSGEIPSTLEFLSPGDTIEKNTDSLRDFIIALDKGKADKLRYKVEDNVVRIFITPYKTSITKDDLDFSQGDFNVDLVIALGVKKQEDLDQAITAHGRILHDATVATVNITEEGSLGSINWNEASASSLSELVTELSQTLGADLLDQQVATALLTGIVAETQRFSNEKTTPQTMSLSAALMAAGANQQLVASKLDEPAPQPIAPEPEPEAAEPEPDHQLDLPAPAPEAEIDHDGALDIAHDQKTEDSVDTSTDAEPKSPTADHELSFNSAAFETEDPLGDLSKKPDLPGGTESGLSEGATRMTEAPTLGGQLTANTEPEAYDPPTDPLTMPIPAAPPLLAHDRPKESESPPKLDVDADVPETIALPSPELEPQVTPPAEPASEPELPPAEPVFTPPPADWTAAVEPPTPAEPEAAESNTDQTLSDIEAAVAGSSDDKESIDAARDEVMKALHGDSSGEPLQPTESLNAQPFFDSIGATDDAGTAGSLQEATQQIAPLPTSLPPPPAAPQAPAITDPTAPPPVPPPIPFNFGNPEPPAAA